MRHRFAMMVGSFGIVLGVTQGAVDNVYFYLGLLVPALGVIPVKTI
jgi:hypothetical protein